MVEMVDDDPQPPGWRGVATTGIYCRMTCGSRPPRPENLRHFYRAVDAEEAGFRPCKRCRPQDGEFEERNAELVAQACRFIEKSETIPKVSVLAKMFGISEGHLHRLFFAHTGLTPRAYGLEKRADDVRRMLAEDLSITETIYETGHNSSGTFYALIDRSLGMVPKHFKRGGEREVLRFSIQETHVGTLATASTEKGVAAIIIGRDAEALAFELQERLPNAELIGDDPNYHRVVAHIVTLVEAQCGRVMLPDDVRATAFQRRLWRAFQHIPAAGTETCEDFARRVIDPRAPSRA